MLSQLLESSPRRSCPHYSTIVSIVGHAMALSGAVVVAHPLVEPDEPETVIVWHPPAPPLPLCTECAPPSGSGSRGPGRVPVPAFPSGPLGRFEVDVPGTLESPDEGVAISEDEWRRVGRGGRSGSPEAGVEWTVVDREVVPHATNPSPRYPADLRAARIEGRVIARFVVDTTGRVIRGSVTVEASTHPAFSDAVIEALSRSRFTPAELRGRKVQQLVSQPFVFVLRE